MNEIFMGVVMLIIGAVVVYLATLFPSPVNIISRILGIIVAVIGAIFVVAGILGIGIVG